MTDVRATWETGPNPAAIGVLRLDGDAAALAACVRAAFDATCPDVGRVTHATLGSIKDGPIDDGVLARVADGVLLVMPHGGPRIRALLDEAVRAVIAPPATIDPAEALAAAWPEARDRFEALALETLARAESALAIDALLAQPDRWRAAGDAPLDETDRARSRRLDRLVTPARVVVVGAANVGKSTLLNALAGRTIAIEADLPGTTRDAVGARLDLAGLAVDWFDTAGLREDAVESERRALALTHAILERADVLVELAAPGSGWPDVAPLPLPPTVDRLRVMTACDRTGASASAEADAADLCVSGLRGDGIAALVDRVVETLVPSADRTHPGRWRFDVRLDHPPRGASADARPDADQSPTIE